MKYLSVIEYFIRSDLSFPPKTFREKKNNWFLQKYPKLEKFHFKLCEDRKVKDIIIFFELNSTIRTFSTDQVFLWFNHKYLLKSKIQLDVLSLRFAV